ncbi:hypothetical protein E4U43_007526 [Claviceps pusilla]|uniref:Uncharacterized protein n=1 Tax=Claviceps pusilla TaxID=123648 RepID=A0A9P7NCN2_9HYPO|nr:hypothetical protein E4U43_007526 [Claviceps pusilla]
MSFSLLKGDPKSGDLKVVKQTNDLNVFNSREGPACLRCREQKNCIYPNDPSNCPAWDGQSGQYPDHSLNYQVWDGQSGISSYEVTKEEKSPDEEKTSNMATGLWDHTTSAPRK